MISSDRQEKERIDARNALEEYVYEIRNKLQEDGGLCAYVDEQLRSQICSQLDDLENWLYEEGENCQREVYRTRLNELHEKSDPIKNRQIEYEGQNQAFNELGHAIQMSYKSVEQFRSGDPKYDHLTETEILNISEQTEKTQKWFEEARNKLHGVNKTQDPPVKISDIRHEYQTLTTCVNSVLSRPKPTPPPPQPKADEQQQQQNGGNTEQPSADAQQNASDKQQQEPQLTDQMDVE
jgi:heat shock protein